MSDHLTREDLKRNELGEAIGAGVEYAGVHVRQIAGGVAAAVVVALAAWGIVAWRQAQRESANQLLGQAIRTSMAPILLTDAKPDDAQEPSFGSESARDGRAQELFERIARDYGATGAGASANLWLADRALRAGDRVSARKSWQQFLDSNREGAMAAIARRNLLRLDREEGKGEAVVSDLTASLERAKDPLPTDALLWELAEAQRGLGRIEEALAAYRRIIDEHADSIYVGEARKALAEVGSAR